MHNFEQELDRNMLSKHYLMISLAESCGLTISEDNWREIEAKLEKKVGDDLLRNGQITRMEPVLVDCYPSRIEINLQ